MNQNHIYNRNCFRFSLALWLGALLCFGYTAWAGSGTWTSLNGGSWTNTANWSGATIADGTNSTADFSTLSLTADATVTLDAARTVGRLMFGDTTPSHNWFLNPGNGGSQGLTLAVSSGAPGILVSNQTATLGVALSGTGGFTKSGSGRLVLTNSSPLTGKISVTNGMLEIAATGAVSNGTGGLSVSGSASSNPALELAGAYASVGGNFTLGASANEVGSANMTGGSLNLSGSSEFVAGNAANATASFVQSGGAVSVTTGNHIYTGMGTGAGTNTTLTLNGGTFTVVPLNSAATFSLGGRSLTTLTLSNSAVLHAHQLRYGWGADLTATDGGVVNLEGGTLRVNRVYLDMPVLQSDFYFNGGRLQALQDNPSFMTGLGNAVIKEGGARIDSQAFNITIAQPLLHGGMTLLDGGLIKRGSGRLTLSGSNTYTGPTVVAEGTLLLTGSLNSTTALSVSNGIFALTAGAQAVTAVSAHDRATLDIGGGSTLTTRSLVLGGVGGVVQLNVVAGSNPGHVPVVVTNLDGLVANGGAESVIVNVAGAVTNVGTCHLVQYSGAIQGAGFDAFKLGSVPGGVSCRLTNTPGFVDLLLETPPPPVLTNGILNVTLDPAFPQPLEYQLASNGAILYGGDPAAQRTVLINGASQTATVTSFTHKGSYALYSVSLPGAALELVYRFELAGNVLVRSLTSVTGAGEANLQTINLGTPILRATADQPGASAAWVRNVNPDLYANYSGDMVGDTLGALTNLAAGSWWSTWCFVHTPQAVGAAYNNLYDYPFTVQVTTLGGVKCAAIYDRDYNYRFKNVKPGVWFESKTCIAGDVNANGVVDWQDGAIWVREQLPPMLPALADHYARGGAWQQTSVGYLDNTTSSTVNTPYPLYASQMRQVFYQTEGVPQTIECAGWTYRGHDWMWADWDQVVNPGAGGRTAYDQARADCAKYNGDLSFHLNQDLSAVESVHYDDTVMARNTSGAKLGYYGYAGQNFYDISHFLDLQAGSLTNRIHNFLDLFAPSPLVVYLDQMWDHPSALADGNGAEEHYAKAMIVRTFRDRGTSTTTEGYQPSLFRNGMLQCKYRANDGVSAIDHFVTAGKLMWQFYTSEPYSMLFGGRISSEFRSGNIFGNNNWMANVLVDDTYLLTMMNAYMRKYPALEYTNDSSQAQVRWGADLIARLDKTSQSFSLIQGDVIIADGKDRFIPALDGSLKVYVYSMTGTANRGWTLPPDWNGVTAVDRYELTECGRAYIDRLSVSNRLVALNTPARVPYILVPAGTTIPPGPVNRAPGNTAAASSVAGSDVAARAIDGNDATAWTASGGSGSWLEINFARETEMNRIELKELGTNISTFRLQCFQGGVWTDMASGTTIGASARAVFPNVRSDRIRLLLDHTLDNPQIAEFKVYSDANLARTATASASVNSGSGWGDNYVEGSLQWRRDIQAARAFDGAPETYWRASGQTGNAWLQAEFSRASKVNRVVLNENGNNVTGFKIQYWDGLAWQDVYTGTTIGGTNEISFTEVQTTKVRLVVSIASASPAISEFQIFDVGGFIPAPIPVPSYNHALNGVASQSSTYSSSGAPQVASRAIDGNTDGLWSANSVSCTAGTELGWWEVDLQAPRSIAQVAVWWRNDCCFTRNQNVDLVIFDTGNTNSRVALARVALSGANNPPNPTVLNLSMAIAGQVVRLEHTPATNLADPNNDQLCLAEVQVYPPPVLSFRLKGGALTFAWPGYGYVLQQNPDLANPAGWADVPGGNTMPAIVAVPATGNLFFRLRNS